MSKPQATKKILGQNTRAEVDLLHFRVFPSLSSLFLPPPEPSSEEACLRAPPRAALRPPLTGQRARGLLTRNGAYFSTSSASGASPPCLDAKDTHPNVHLGDP